MEVAPEQATTTEDLHGYEQAFKCDDTDSLSSGMESSGGSDSPEQPLFNELRNCVTRMHENQIQNNAQVQIEQTLL